MRPNGNPPALFNEGFAVYMSEKLGAKALESLGGGSSSLYARVKKLKNNGQWINLEELMIYNEIGSEKTQPYISYAEAGAFVKFLIEKYGRDKFLQIYQTLKNSDDKMVHKQNIKKLTDIYGRSLEKLEKEWEDTFLSFQ